MPSKTDIQTISVNQTVPKSVFSEILKKTKPVADKILSLSPSYPDYEGLNKLDRLSKDLNSLRKQNEKIRKKCNAEPQKFIRTVNAVFKAINNEVDMAKRHSVEVRRAFKEAERKEELRRQKISVARGGSGDNIKEVDTTKNHTTSRKIPDHQKIRSAIDEAAKKLDIGFPLEIAGVEIYPVWKFEIYDSGKIPDEFKKDSFIDA